MKIQLMDLAAKLSLANIKKLAALKGSGGKISKLMKKKAALEKKIAKVAAQIAALTGGKTRKGKPGRKPGKRRGKRAAGLTEAIRGVLGTSTKPLRVADIVGALPGKVKAGQKVQKLKASVSTIVAGSKGFRRTGIGLYTVAVEKAKAKKAKPVAAKNMAAEGKKK